MSHSVHTNGPISLRVRKIAGPVVLAGALGAGAFAAPAAFASPVSSVRSHLRAADMALHAVASANIKSNLSVPLSALTSQLESAAHISANLAVHAHTPNLEKLAGTALGLVANEETKAEEVLTAATSTVSNVELSAVVKADETIAGAREAGLNALAHVTATANVSAHAVAHVLSNELTTLTAEGKSLLVGLSDAVQEISGSVEAAVPAMESSLATTVTADVNMDLGRITGVVSSIGGVVPTTISTLESLTAQVISGGDTSQDPTDTGCPTGGCTATTPDANGGMNVDANVSVNAVLSGLISL